MSVLSSHRRWSRLIRLTRVPRTRSGYKYRRSSSFEERGRTVWARQPFLYVMTTRPARVRSLGYTNCSLMRRKCAIMLTALRRRFLLAIVWSYRVELGGVFVSGLCTNRCGLERCIRVRCMIVIGLTRGESDAILCCVGCASSRGSPDASDANSSKSRPGTHGDPWNRSSEHARVCA